ncbi:ferritin-like domain-containing protein, partial [Mesorhizobium sp. M8A.F.Ca.ET.207.01.1.1]
ARVRPDRGPGTAAALGDGEEGAALVERRELHLDAGLVGAAQAVEHYEIARYGTLIAWAEQLGMKDAIPLLRETLKEETATDEALSALGESDANERALQAACSALNKRLRCLSGAAWCYDDYTDAIQLP